MKILNLFSSQKVNITIGILIGFLCLNVPAFAQSAGKAAANDSLYKKLTIDELTKIKKYFDRKVNTLREDEESFRTRGMDWSESFLNEKGSSIRDRDKVYIRLAEYYVEDSERSYDVKVEQYEVKFQEYEKQLALFDDNQIAEEPVPPEFPKYDYSSAIQVYDRLLEEYPASDFADDALYSKSWLMEKMNEGAESRKIYYEVIDKYPESPFAAESYMRLAEYFFNPAQDTVDEEQTVVQLQKAISLYKNVLKFRDSKRYDEALYKLGWSYYKLAARDPKYYNDAISYFLTVADDISNASKFDPRSKITNADVRDEAIEYIGISFTDEAYTKSGVDKARNLIERIGGREYGGEIMQAIGQTFQKIDEPEKAIYAYQNLLEMYPFYESAPRVQQYIVDALFVLGKDSEAYQARRTLYENYNPGSEWYQNTDNTARYDKFKYLNEAYKYSEAALRTNLLLDLEKAEEMSAQGLPTQGLYEQFAEGCRGYLELFPADSNAYDINWSLAFMLDSRLSRFDEAFEEYIRVSNDYLLTSHQHDAALNAVATADTLVEIKYGQKDTTKLMLGDIASLNPEALTEEETRLIEGYNNYIRLFPTGQFTPNFLAAAGGIYYNHKKFSDAKVYFQTLVKRFPRAEERSLAMRSIMDSYFALGKFKDSEIVAKRILSGDNVSIEQKDFARKRMGQAIFKNAEFLETKGEHFEAATEYVRVYREAPADNRLVETALFNAGINYQRAKDWLRSASIFDTLVAKYPTSDFAVDALENMADDYKEMEQYANCAQTYERIFNNYRDSKNAETALYNSSYYYKKAESWNDAIRANDTYIAEFPAQPFSKDLFFSNAELYLNLDNLVQANSIYEQFARNYPDDPRTVAAFFERGKYYLNNGQTEQAKAELNLAIERSEGFRRQGKDPNAFIAGEAVNTLAEILHKEFVSIELRQPESNIEGNKVRLRNILKELNQTYSKVLSFGSPRSFEATYNIARSYEELADIFAGQEIDSQLSEDQKFVEKKKINEQAAGLYEKAVEQYKEVITNIPLIAEKFGVDMNQVVEEKAAVDDSLMSTEGITRVVEQDSTRDLAISWHGKARDKVSQLLYTQASLTSENVYQAISIKSPEQNSVESIAFKFQVLKKVAEPAIKQTIDAHLRNIREAEALGLSNKYVEESKRQILLTSNLMGAEVELLAYKTLDEFNDLSKELSSLVEKEFGTVNEKGQDYYTVDNFANQMIDYTKILSTDILTTYINTLALARENNIHNDLIRNTKDRMLRYAVEVTDKMSEYGAASKDKSTYYQAQFDSTENYNFDDATGFFENYFYSFNDNSKQILDRAFEAREEYEINNLWANKLLYKLILLDPVAYSASIEKEKVVITSDDTWRYSRIYFPEQWTRLDFDDSAWDYAEPIYDTSDQFAAMDINPQAIWIKKEIQLAASDSTELDSTTMNFPDTLATDSFAITDSAMTDTSTSYTGEPSVVSGDTLAFFRKTFELEGTPVFGEIYATADNDFRIYLNGEYLIDDEYDDFSVIDTLDYYTFDIFLKQGTNVLSIDVEDKDMSGQGFKFYGFFEILPADITAAAEESAKERKVYVDPQILKKVNILNKNRISSNR